MFMKLLAFIFGDAQGSFQLLSTSFGTFHSVAPVARIFISIRRRA